MKYLLLFLYSTILHAQVVGTGTEDFTCGTQAQGVQLAQAHLVNKYGIALSNKPAATKFEELLSLLTFKIVSKDLDRSSINPSSELSIECKAITEEGKDCKSLANENLIKLSIDLKDFSDLTRQAMQICFDSHLERKTQANVKYLYSNEMKKHLKTIEQLTMAIDKRTSK